jgi:S1-C subfamily serine protease
MDLVMRTQYLTLFLCAILSVASSVVAAVFTTQSLDQYAQTLFSDSRYALLAPHRVGEPSDGSLEGLERVRTQVGDTMILFTKDTVKPATLASQFITADGILGWGVVLSSDGWVVSYIAEDENLVAWKDGVRFAVDRVVRDADTDMALFHLRDAQNMPVAAFAGTAVLQSGETLFAAQDAHTLSPVALADARYPLFPSSRLAHVISTQWLFAENLPLQSFLFSSSGALAGFSLDTQTAVPLHHLQDFLIQTMRNVAYQPPKLAVYVVDIARQPTLNPALRQGVTQGALILAPSLSEPAVVKGSAAAKAGLLANDIILAVDGEAVTLQSPLDDLLRLYAVGQTVELTVMRGGERVKLRVILE